MKRSVILLFSGFLLVLLAVLLFSRDVESDAAGESDRLRVVTTILPVFCFAANVAGERALVENLLPAGVGPHDYQFSPRDLRRLSRADLIVVNGLQLESWLEGAMRRISRAPKIVVASAGLEEWLIYDQTELKLVIEEEEASGGRRSHRHGHGHSHGHSHAGAGPNPHVWLDPRLAAHAVGNVLEAMQTADPVNAEAYASNAREYIERLEALDAEMEEALAGVRELAFVTYHDAFPYFTRRYGLNLAGVIEQTPEVQPSLRYLEQLHGVIREKDVRAIFIEPQFSSKLARQMSRDLEVPLAELDPLETGLSFTPEAYEEGMRRNLSTLLNSLQNGDLEQSSGK